MGQAVGGGCQSGWGPLLSVTNIVEPATCRQWLGIGWAPWRGATFPPSDAFLVVRLASAPPHAGAFPCSRAEGWGPHT